MVRFFDKKLSLFILYFLLPLLFLPKINLIQLGSETAGIRIDDLFLFIFASLFFFSHALLRKKIEPLEKWILGLTLFCLVSFFSNRLLVALGHLPLDAKIFYAVRLLEYFLFFYIGSLASRFDCTWMLPAFFAWNFFIMTLQKLNLAGGVSVGGYSDDVSSRVQGVASFPSEMGLLLNLLFCYILFSNHSNPRTDYFFSTPLSRFAWGKLKPYLLFVLFSLFVIFTGNRISIVALFFCFAGKMKEEINWRSKSSFIAALCILPLLIAAITFGIFQTDAVSSRSASLFSMQNIHLAEIVWDKIDMDKNPVGNEVISAKEYDMSWWMRIHKWIFVMKVFVNHPEVYLQGLGPGFAWSALDGGLLRIFIEVGIIGSYLYYRFFAAISAINRQLKWMTVAFVINMIFFDAYLAYKTMSFYFFAAGFEYEKMTWHKNHPGHQIIAST
ncbi:MAG: hypothetical protein LW832_08095 [Parachlamydia sp.]|jgi:hypothetical protein|nr:hypothetical protein [Parachlamydia sp.]